MFREMRRGRQALPEEMCEAVLSRGNHGVLALAGDEGYPYAVPISYVYGGGKLYFHCAKSGHKLGAIARCPKASFCVVAEDQVDPHEYTTYFRSVIAFGRIRILADDAQKRSAIDALAAKYAPNAPVNDRKRAIDREWEPLCMLEMEIDHLTGKEAIELVQQPPATE